VILIYHHYQFLAVSGFPLDSFWLRFRELGSF